MPPRMKTIENCWKPSPEETDPTISDAPLHRSTCIYNMSKGILEKNSSTYAQFPVEEKEPVNISLPDTGHTSDGYVYSTFNDE